MPKESKQQNLFFKKSLTGHLGAGGHHPTSDHSGKSTPTASEDEAGTRVRTSRGSEQRETEQRDTEQAVSVGQAATEQAAAEERGAKIRTERFHPTLNDSANEAERSVSTSSDGRDNRMTDSKTSKRPMKTKKDHIGRGSYSHRGAYRSGKSDRRDSGRMGYFPRGPRPMIPFPHHGRPPPPPHILEQLSQSPRDSAFMGPISSPRRTPRHSESSSCGSPLHYSGQTPPQSPRHFYESPVHSPLRHHISPYNSPPRHSASPIPRMMPPDVMHTHPAMMPPQHAMPSIPVPLPQPEMGLFPGTPPQHFHPMNNPQMRPMTPEQQHMVAAMQHHQQRVAEQQLEHHHQQQQQMVHQLKMKHTQESFAQLMMQMKQMALQGQNITMTPEQLNQLHWHFMSQQQNMNMVPGGQGMVPQPWMQQGGPQQEMMMNPIPQPNPEMPQRLLQSGPMSQQMHSMFMQQQQQHQLSGFMGQHVPFNMNQMMEHSQPIMVPQPIHPEMGNTSRITPPQNVNNPLNHSNVDLPRIPNFPMQPQHFVPPTQMAMQVPSPNIAVSSPSLPVDVPETVTITTPSTEQAAVNVEPVKPQDTVYNSSIPTTMPPTTTKSRDVTSPQIETPTKTPSSTPETLNKTAKTPGLIRLPPQLPTEEEMMKSPDSATPVSMKKNYWQKRQKSTESAEKKGQLELPQLQEGTEKEVHEAPTKIPDAEKPKESDSKATEAKADTHSSDTPSPAETPKKSSGKVVKSKAFNLSDLGDLVSSTVKHNSNIPKTDICTSSGSVEIVLNQGIRRTQSPCLARASERTDSRDGDNWRPLSREAKAKVEATPSWRAQDNPASSRISDEDPGERKHVLREAESKELSTGQQIQYAIGKLQFKSPGQRTASESSSKSVKEDVVEGEEAWYDEEDEDQIDCFDLTI